MPITGVAKTNGHVAGASSATIASQTWTQNKLYLITVLTLLTGAPETPAISGATQKRLRLHHNSNVKSTLFAFLGDGSTGSKAINVNSVVHDRIQWTVDEIDGVKITGVNAADAFVQSADNSAAGGTNMAATLAAFADPVKNAAWVWAFSQGGAVITPEAGYTTLASNSDFFTLKSAFKVGQDTSPSLDQATTNGFTVIAVELAADTIIKQKVSIRKFGA